MRWNRWLSLQHFLHDLRSFWNKFRNQIKSFNFDCIAAGWITLTTLDLHQTIAIIRFLNWYPAHWFFLQVQQWILNEKLSIAVDSMISVMWKLFQWGLKIFPISLRIGTFFDEVEKKEKFIHNVLEIGRTKNSINLLTRLIKFMVFFFFVDFTLRTILGG